MTHPPLPLSSLAAKPSAYLPIAISLVALSVVLLDVAHNGGPSHAPQDEDAARPHLADPDGRPASGAALLRHQMAAPRSKTSRTGDGTAGERTPRQLRCRLLPHLEVLPLPLQMAWIGSIRHAFLARCRNRGLLKELRPNNAKKPNGLPQTFLWSACWTERGPKHG